MKIVDQIILSISKFCTDEKCPYKDFYEDEFESDEFAEICIFNFCYAWLFILDEDLMRLTDENILKYQLFCLRFINEISSSEIEPIEFVNMFRERYTSYRQELEDFKERSDFPSYSFFRLFLFPLKKGSINDSNIAEEYFSEEGFSDEDTFRAAYISQINFLQTNLENLI
ncbi:hypothetical protein [uncultured Flavobacterium sp.]|uniref:hypothetical protein n=1 Tax=uncultured Flavobacterium sp. TaxID=165435 RepID=UPI0025DA164D|nr:hypothetical protein [uncultured Flavobacterium sp.]